MVDSLSTGLSHEVNNLVMWWRHGWTHINIPGMWQGGGGFQ